MRILIIGGTSFMGPYTTRNLRAAGHEVTLFHRGKTKTELPEGVQEMLGDRDHLADYASEFQRLEPDVVLDMMLMTEQQARDLMATFAGVARRVVVISSQDVYQAFGRVNRHEDGDADPSVITEDSPLRANLYPYRGETRRDADDPQHWIDDYDKILVERVIMSQPDLPGTALRLPAVYGPGDRQHRMFRYLKPMLDGRPAILLEEHEANWRWTHGYVENVADAIALAVTDERASGRIYNIGEPFVLSMTEHVEQIARAANWQGRVVTLPAARIPKGLLWDVNADQDVVVDTGRIRHELGYSERIDMRESFQRTIAWERANPPEKIDPATFDYAAEDAALAEL